jgi:hypothetical protein
MAFRIWKTSGTQKPSRPGPSATEEQAPKNVQAQLHQEYPLVVSELDGETLTLHGSRESKETDFEYDSLGVVCHKLLSTPHLTLSKHNSSSRTGIAL